MAYSTIPKVRRDGVITLKDGTSPTPIQLQISYEEGNLSFDVTKADQTVIRDRGTIVTVRKGDDQPAATGSFSAYFRQFTDTTPEAGSIIDFIDKAQQYASNVSTGASGVPFVEHYCIDLEYRVEGTSLGDDTDQSATLSKCICTFSFAEGDPSAFTISFTCYGGVTYANPT